jgi:hypothetical protein
MRAQDMDKICGNCRHFFSDRKGSEGGICFDYLSETKRNSRNDCFMEPEPIINTPPKRIKEYIAETKPIKTIKHTLKQIEMI